jgi:ribulose-5-phosphate 4-epimerase/fuculose-1-phosphate aldolase
MADGAAASLKSRVSEAEWTARVELAALYRLVALHGWDDMIFTHISARVPGPEHHFLINPYGWYFEEMTASCLIKVDLDGNIVQETDAMINPAGFTIHSAIHAAREDATVVMHLHTDQGVAVSSQKEGLLPISQTAMIVREYIAYHDYEGVALDLDERERLVADLGPTKHSMLLRNHGTLTCGESAALMVGKFLTPDLYVGYGVGLMDAVNTFNVKYRISRRLMFESTSSAIGTGADLVYTIER